MKTQVETYEMTDVREETPEQSAEAKALIESLGLKGQMHEAEAGAQVLARFPYRCMTREEEFVYTLLCPRKTSATEYAGDPMPIEVLKTIAYARTLQDKRIAYLEVWAADSVSVKDPVLVGRPSYYNTPIYILARWGEELLPLSVLLPDALKKWHAARIDKLNDIKAEVESALLKPCPLSAPERFSEPSFSP